MLYPNESDNDGNLDFCQLIKKICFDKNVAPVFFKSVIMFIVSFNMLFMGFF